MYYLYRRTFNQAMRQKSKKIEKGNVDSRWRLTILLLAASDRIVIDLRLPPELLIAAEEDMMKKKKQLKKEIAKILDLKILHKLQVAKKRRMKM